jgi:putative MFS transporter
MSSIQAKISAGARLDRLPWTSYHTKLLLLLMLGEWMETYDLQTGGIVLPSVAGAFKVDVATASFNVLSVIFFGAFFGAVILGRLADRVGRRTIVVYNLIITSIAYLLTPFAPSIQILGVIRFIAGVGTGAEIPLMFTMVGEFFPARVRGRSSARAFAVGYTAPGITAVIASYVLPTHVLLEGWQWMFIFGGLGLLVVLPLRFLIPESPRFLERVGRNEECEKILSRFEAIAIKEKGQIPDPEMGQVAPEQKSDLRELFGPALRRRTAMLWIMQFMQTGFSYGMGALATIVLVSKGFTIVRSVQYSAIIFLMYPCGLLVSSFISDSIKFDRKWQLPIGWIGFGILSLLFGLSTSPLEAVITGSAAIFWNSAISFSGMYTYPSELYPTRLRTTGNAWQYALSRLGNTLWLTWLPLVLQDYGGAVMLAVTMVMTWIAALDIAILGPKASQIRLEVLSK